MNRGVIELGRQIRSFRNSAGITQHELADQLRISRSAIALMEQGRRLLAVDSLKSVAEFLTIPQELVQPFMSPALQRRRNKTTLEPSSFVPFNIMCVSGISGSGKTTLAEVVARSFAIPQIGSHPTGRAYLKDLSNNSDRWAFEAQVAFLVSKTFQIHQMLEGGRSIVVERWIDEDIQVYERLFEEVGSIDGRGQDTFRLVGQLADTIVSSPEYRIYCRCDVETALSRINSRGRADSRLHSREFMERSKQLYEAWLQDAAGPETYILDTDESDLKKPGIIEEVFRDIQMMLTHNYSDPQGSLFDLEMVAKAENLKHLRPYHPDRWSPLVKTRRKSITAASPLVAPIAYVAAPFTGQDTVAVSESTQSTLFGDVSTHGVIPRAGFRNELLGIERALANFGIAALIPHRDVNEWGKKQLAPEEAMRACTDHVSACDLFVGILGNSCGAHYEFGIATTAGKPCVVLAIRDFPQSFLAGGAGILESDDVIVLECPTLRSIEETLQSSEKVRLFIDRHLGGVGRI